MATYDLAFARKFAEVAQSLVLSDISDGEARRVVAYISRLSMELAIKSLLETAGLPIPQIRRHWHNLRSLLAEVDKLEVEVLIAPGAKAWVRASRVRAINVLFIQHSCALGVILEAENHGASAYPNELRYGVMPKDFPPEALAAAAFALVQWIDQHNSTVRRP